MKHVYGVRIRDLDFISPLLRDKELSPLLRTAVEMAKKRGVGWSASGDVLIYVEIGDSLIQSIKFYRLEWEYNDQEIQNWMSYKAEYSGG